MSIKKQAYIAISIFLLLAHHTSYTMDASNFIKEIGHIADVISPEIGNLIHGQQPAIKNNPHKHDVARVRLGSGISEGEREYLKKRAPFVQKTLEDILQCSLEEKKPLTIAAACSGGGYRALLCTLGFMQGLEKNGMLNAITYITALSGSTWMLAPWISLDMSLEDFEKYILECVSKKIDDVTTHERHLIESMFAVKRLKNQPITLVEEYGGLLANRLLAQKDDMRHMTYLSGQTEIIKDGSKPYPIYTMIDGRERVYENPACFECTPHEISSTFFKVYIPTWAYGCKFKNGVLQDNAPEQSLGHFMGTWGSAFAATIKRAEESINKTVHNSNILPEHLKETIIEPVLHGVEETILKPVEDKRPVPCYAKIHNYMRKLENNEFHDETLKKKKYIKFVDQGLKRNLPYEPVSGLCSERKADVIFIFDASGGCVGNELKKTEEYAREKKLPFPKIDYTDIDKKTISIFIDENDPTIPFVIYMPRINDPELWKQNKHKQEYENFGLDNFNLDAVTHNGFAETQHFHYKLKNSKRVINTTKFNMMVNKVKIVEVLAKAIALKSNQK